MLPSKVVIDCTGDGDVAAAAGAALYMRRRRPRTGYDHDVSSVTSAICSEEPQELFII